MIRSPDEYRTERLNNNFTPNSRHHSFNDISYVEQMKIAIEISSKDYSDEMEHIEEQQILEIYQEQCKIRENEISSILLKLKKVSKYDKEVSEILFILEDIFSQYKNGYIECYYLDEEHKNKIWKILSQIRFTEDEKNSLKRIIK